MAYNYFGQPAAPQAIGNAMMMPTQDDAALALGQPQQQPPVVSTKPSLSPATLQALAAALKAQGSAPGTGTGLTPQFAQGLANPNASAATGNGLTNLWKQSLMSPNSDNGYFSFGGSSGGY